MEHFLDLLFIAHIHLAQRKLFFKREGCAEKIGKGVWTNPDVYHVQNGLTVLRPN